MSEGIVTSAAFYRLFDEAERVRWTMHDIPFERIERERADRGLCAVVRETAYAELTTHSATRRFLQDFSDDADLTQWMSVWFYEENKHSQVLLRWLSALGVHVDEAFVLRGRATAPFMRSRMGTLVTNIVSEMVASNGYRALELTSPEPVLGKIARNIAGDESRHAASFYVYAQRHLARSKQPEHDRRDALKVLYAWFQENERVAHPVSEFHGRATSNEETAETWARLGMGMAPIRDRICALVGTLVGDRLDGVADVAVRLGVGAKGDAIRVERETT